MASSSVQSLLDDIRLLSDTHHRTVEAVRALVKQTVPGVTEQVKYGGILFTAGVPFGGVFAYKQHVTVEFSHGAKIQDDFGHLEGAGKGRRHIKLSDAADIERKQLAAYLLLAHQAAAQG
jgi:hypothetical protein